METASIMIEVIEGMKSEHVSDDELQLTKDSLTNSFVFGFTDSTADLIEDQYEAGLAYSYRERPIRLGFISLERLGLGYRFSSNDNYRAISINFSSWFTR